jgi:uncharacterized protein (DUF697 family)
VAFTAKSIENAALALILWGTQTLMGCSMTDMSSVPVNKEALEKIRQECRDLVRKRALVSAGAAVVPIPFLDVVVDASILIKLIPEINQRFGLDPDSIDRMSDQQREHVWRNIRQRGSQLLGIVITRSVIRKSFDSLAGRLVTRQVTKFIPFGGQIVAAGLGYFVLRKIAYKHIEDCYAVVDAA